MRQNKMTSTEKLVKALEEAHAPEAMINRAKAGGYNDFESDSATPCIDLVNDLAKAGLSALRVLAMNGEFDATKEESDAWAKRMATDPEVGPLLRKLKGHA